MFVRRIKSRKSICFQIGEKRYGKFRLIKHVGCSSDPSEIEALQIRAEQQLQTTLFENQPVLFPQINTSSKAALLSWHITGYHRTFGSVYDSIGFPHTLLRDLVVARIVYPKSKSATVRYLERYLGIVLKRDRVYRFLDTLDKDELMSIAFKFVSQKNNGMALCFYDVTTLYFETETTDDDFRKKGFSKDHRGDMPQIVIGLFVDHEGYPFDFELFEGNTFEGHTFSVAIERLMKKYSLKEFTVVADAGMLSADNLGFLESKHVSYIVGARLKNMTEEITKKIVSHNYAQSIIQEIILGFQRLIVEYSEARAKKDVYNRDTILAKLTQKLQAGKPVIHKNKYILVKDQGKVTGLDTGKIAEDKKFDGLKGYITNASNRSTVTEVIEQYRNLWKVEKAFRMSKGDLKERPIFHHQIKRIKSHVLICFVSLLVMKEAEKILHRKKYSLEKTIEVLGKVGQGEVRIGTVKVEVESELSPEVQAILKLFDGH